MIFIAKGNAYFGQTEKDELIEPKRQTNIPNFGKIISRAYKDGFDVCQYCDGLQCQNCIVDEWKNETEDEQ